MNKQIYISSLKSNGLLYGIFALCSLGTIISLMWIFPDMIKENTYEDLLTSLPEGLLKSFGIIGDPSNLNDYMNMNFYNSIYLYILIAFVLVGTTRLVAKHISDTSLTYYLNSPISRGTFFRSQVMVFFTGIVIMTLASVLGGVFTQKILLVDYDFDTPLFIKTNLIIMVLFLVFSGLSFLICSLCSSNGVALAISGGVMVTEYLLYMIKNMNENLSELKYWTFFSMFNPKKIADDEGYFAIIFVLCFLIAIVFMLAGNLYFKRRDLYI